MTKSDPYFSLPQAERSALQAVWSGRGASRVELARALGVSKVAVSKPVARLIDSGLLAEEPGEADQIGRPPIQLALKADSFYSIGVSLFNRHGAIALADARQETIAQEPLGDLPVASDARLSEVGRRIRRLLARHGIPRGKLSGIGLAVSGISDPDKGRVIHSPDFPADRDFDLCPPLARALDAPCQLMNIPHLLAVMEQRWGGARDFSDFLYLHSQGFGLGMFLRGALYRGARHWAGELGEMQIRAHQDGDLTRRTGTLGEVAPLYRVTDRLKDLMTRGGETLVGRYFKPGSKYVTVEMVTAAIEAGDQLSAQLLSETFLVIGEAALSLAFLLNPQAIFLDPFTARIPQVTLEVVRRLASLYGPRDWSLQVQILPARCGEEDLARGAALLPAAARLGIAWDRPPIARRPPALPDLPHPDRHGAPHA